MIRLIATDMDGTFLEEGGKFPKHALNVVKKLIKKDILFTVASGRQCQTLEKDFEPVKDNIAVIAENGALVKCKGKTLCMKSFPIEMARDIIRDIRTMPGASLVLCGQKAAYIEEEKPFLRSEVDKYYYSNCVVSDLTTVEDHVLKIAIHQQHNIKEAWKTLNVRWGHAFKIVISGEVWIDICVKDANKGEAIKILQKYLEITPEETMAFGDYFNDLEMLQNAVHSYVMENAPEELKKHAKFVAKTNGVLDIIAKKALD